MKTLVAGVAALVLLGGAPALAMSCCGGPKGKAGMCTKGGTMGGMKGSMAMGRTEARGGKGCCCEGMSPGRMSRRG